MTTESASVDFEVSLPTHDGSRPDQDEEFCEIVLGGERRRIRFHDYHEIYSIPGLYEHLFYEMLECDSPRTVAESLRDQLAATGREAAELRVFEVGAGNGMVGRELAELGVRTIVGVDIIPEAKMAAERDRPGVYEDYLVLDLTNIPPETKRDLEARGFNCLVTVAALGFGDIPPNAFAEAYNLVEQGGLVAFNIKEDFISDGDGSGFSRLIKQGLADGALEVRSERRYQHRLAVSGEPLHYVALVAEKRADLPIQ